MLIYVFTRHTLAPINTRFATPFELKSVADHIGQSIPHSHVYVTSKHYHPYIIKALKGDVDKLEQLNQQQAYTIESNRYFPQDFKNRQFRSVTELHKNVIANIGDRDHVHIAVINGIGNGLGDNVMGLASLQRLRKLLAPLKVTFHLLQELNYRTAALYMYEENVQMYNSIMSLEQFMAMDFYIDLSDAKNLPNFDRVATALYTTHAFSINNLVGKTNLQAQITTDKSKTALFKELLKNKLNNGKSNVLLHPKASSDLRALPNHVAAGITRSLIANDVNVISAFPHDNPPDGFVDVSSYSNSIDDLTHIIDAVDGVISVGTVVYHMAAALGKPTILLPTVWPDIRSAQLLPEVSIHLQKNSEKFVQDLHNSDDPTHMAASQRLWSGLDSQALALHIKKHVSSFRRISSSFIAAPLAPARVCVFLLSHVNEVPLHFDRLIRVEGFDVLYCHVLDPHYSLFQQRDFIQAQAALNKAEFIWFVVTTEAMTSDSLVNTMVNLESNPELSFPMFPLVDETSETAPELDNFFMPAEQVQNYLDFLTEKANGVKT